VDEPRENDESTGRAGNMPVAGEVASAHGHPETNGTSVEVHEEPSPSEPLHASDEPDTIRPEDYVSPADADESEHVRPIEESSGSDEPPKLEWYILKVQSNREDSIREGLERRVKIAGLEKYFGEIIVPTELVTEFKGGKKKVVKRKLYPGYLVVQMEINDETWFLVRETPGIGDFTGTAGKPAPMRPQDVAKIVQKTEETTAEQPKLVIGFQPSDRVKIKEGTFENFEGDVDAIDEANGRVTVMINIFGRSTPVELEYWQIEKI
jgi:transcriptional antiterminator NusG